MILVTEWDKSGIKEGELFHHSKDKDEIVRKMGEIPKEQEQELLYGGAIRRAACARRHGCTALEH